MYYDRIDLREGIDPANSNNRKECMVCHYWFLNHGFRFQDYVCIGCHDLLISCFNITNIAITTVKSVLFMILTNLKQFFCYKIMCLMIMSKYKMHA